jgi:hypothetical protein
VSKARDYVWKNYYFKDDAFPNQTRPFRWYIEKFAPVPGWEAYLTDRYEAPRVIVFYTDSQLDERLAHAVRKNLATAAGPIPIISVSQKPLAFGQNICVGTKPRLHRSVYEQFLTGVEAAPLGSIVYLCEHDVFYHPSHFAKLPDDNQHVYCNQNLVHFALGRDAFLESREKRALGHWVAHRDVLIAHAKQRLAAWQTQEKPPLEVPLIPYKSVSPNVDVRHGGNLTRSSDYQRAYETGKIPGQVKKLGSWGGTHHFGKKTGYRRPPADAVASVEEDTLKAKPRVILYYTDSQLHTSLANAVRRNLQRVAGSIPIISVSQEPLDFGQNVCLGEKPRSPQSMYEQILAGAKAAPEGAMIYLCEHDVFYHGSHFATVPGNGGQFYFNQNRVYWHVSQETFLPGPKGSRAFSQGVVGRECLIQHCEQALVEWKSRLNIDWQSWESARPNVDIRHGQNLTKDGAEKRPYSNGRKPGVNHIGGWGGMSHFQRRVKYKGVMRADIINYLIKLNHYTSYLEIGAGRPDTWREIVCETKHGVDPNGTPTFRMTSDEFFTNHCEQKYDLIFVDGLHHADQAYRDFVNALEALTSEGVLVAHDCSPRNEKEQHVPQLRGIKAWTGDVWKAYIQLRQRSDLEMYVVNTNNGVGIIRLGEQEPLVLPPSVTYEAFAQNQNEWLNLKSIEHFWEYEKIRIRQTAVVA